MRRVAWGLAIAMVAFALGIGSMAAWYAFGAADVAASASPSPSPSRTPPAPEPIITPSPDLPFDVPYPSATEPGFSKHAYVLDTPVSPWVVVNKLRPLEPQDYVPPELVPVSGIPGDGDQLLIPEAADALHDLYAAADAEGAGFRISSAYRSFDRQAGLYRRYVREWGTAKAETFTARPGFSEHQTGRAVDIFTSEECKLEECFADTAAAKFVAAHAHEYGFIVRYPPDKQDVTGYRHEPWHLRYVGVELAQEMYTVGPYTMEEFFGLPAAPDYLD
jgi:D-alanyl-D-alanine carboxypeptidase